MLHALVTVDTDTLTQVTGKQYRQHAIQLKAIYKRRLIICGQYTAWVCVHVFGGGGVHGGGTV